MSKLIDSNPHLKDKAQRDKLIIQSIISSSACEGITLTPADFRKDSVKKTPLGSKPPKA